MLNVTFRTVPRPLKQNRSHFIVDRVQISPKRKKVRFTVGPAQVLDITPRHGKTLGKITMPNDPPYPYSRATFFKLLVREGLVCGDLSKGEEYVKGAVELNVFGIPEDRLQSLRTSIKAENSKGPFSPVENCREFLQNNQSSDTGHQTDGASSSVPRENKPSSGTSANKNENATADSTFPEALQSIDFSRLPVAKSETKVRVWLRMDLLLDLPHEPMEIDSLEPLEAIAQKD